MANLLPIVEQKKIWRMYRARFMIAAAYVFFAIALLTLSALVPSYVILALSTDSVESRAASTERVDDPTAMSRAQILVDAISPLISATTTPTEIIASAISARPKLVLISKVTYAPGQLVLSGIAPRESIDVFRTELGKTPLFTAVSVPVSALVGRDENRFSITISGNF